MENVKVAIIGSGPAGYSAAVYTARAQLQPVVFEGQKGGGQLMWTTEVENFPGFPTGINGPELMMGMRAQAERFGAKLLSEYVTAVDFSVRPFKLWTGFPAGFDLQQFEQLTPELSRQLVEQVKINQPTYLADSVIISTGAVSKMIGVPGEQEFLGRGVSTCAVCDAAFYKDKVTYVVGGGDSAMEDTLALTKFAQSVTVIHRRDQFKASKIMQERVLNHPKVKVMWNSAPLEIKGADQVTSLVVKTQTDQGEQIQELPTDGVFVAIGHTPMNQLFSDQVQLDDHGYIVTRQSLTSKGVSAAQQAVNGQGLVQFPSMTSVAGVFAAGDNVDVRYKQAITAAGQGCSAALDAERWLESQD